MTPLSAPRAQRRSSDPLRWLPAPLRSEGAVTAACCVVALFVVAAGFKLGHPGLAALALVAVGAGLVALRYVDVALGVLVFATFTNAAEILSDEHGVPAAGILFIGGAAVLVAARTLLFNERRSGLVSAGLLVLPMALAGMASLANAEYFWAARGALVLLAKGIILFLLIGALIQTRKHVKITFNSLLGAGCFISTFSFLQEVVGVESFEFWGFAAMRDGDILGRTQSHRIGGPIGDPNYYAMVLVALLPIAVERIWSGARGLERALAWWFVVTGSASILFTYSRGALIGLAVVAGLLLVLKRPSPRLVVATAIVGLVTIVALPEQYSGRIRSIPDAALKLLGQDTGTENDVQGRVSEWIIAMRMFREHPVFGIGTGNYAPNYQAYSVALGLDSRLEERQPHSLYLEIASETGLVGLAGFAILVGGVLLALWRPYFSAEGARDGRLWALFSGLAGYLACSLFLHGAYPNYFWLYFGIALATGRILAAEPAATTSSTAAERAVRETLVGPERWRPTPTRAQLAAGDLGVARSPSAGRYPRTSSR